MNPVRLVTIFCENKAGQLARLTKVLADASINVRWVNIATSDKFGVIRFLVDKCELALERLKDRGFTVSLVEVLAVEVPDKPGGLYSVAEFLARHNVNIENSSRFVTESRKRAVLIIEVHELAQARQVLQKQGLHLFTQEELLNI